MRALWRFASPVALLVAAACGQPGSPGGGNLTAAGAVGAESAPVPPSSSTTAPVAVTAPTPTRPPGTVAPPTTVRPTATTRAPAAATPPIKGYAPAPPPPGVEPDGYGGYGGLTHTISGGTTVTLQVYAREQYWGSTTQVGAIVVGTEAVKSLTIDFGDGHVLHSPELASWYCTTSPRSVSDGRNHVYAEPGVHRVTVTAVVTPCQVLTGPPEGTIGPDGKPWVTDPTRLMVSMIGERPVSASMDILQRPDPPPRPVGPAPGP